MVCYVMLSGYRSIWHALRLRHHIHVPRNLVATIMKEIDPVGVEERRSRRLKRRTFSSNKANASWHIDGNFLFLFFFVINPLIQSNYNNTRMLQNRSQSLRLLLPLQNFYMPTTTFAPTLLIFIMISPTLD